jgi:protein-S-isoprenylcysteine O-methyltransferase Ste14
MTTTLFDLLFRIEMGYAIIAFLSLFFIAAPYGRHIKKGWGPTMSARNAWILQEVPAFSVIVYYFLANQGYQNPVLIIFLLIWQVHYFHRTFIYPFKINHPKKSYPTLLVLMGIAFNSINGMLHGGELFILREYEQSWFYSPNFIVGLVIFLSGYAINKQSDRILFSLRGQNGSYVIPNGGLYRWISCPNYFGELLEWLGWAILTWSTAGFGFFIFTFANLFPRAISNHQWYLLTFKDYPKTRKAIIPFLI